MSANPEIARMSVAIAMGGGLPENTTLHVHVDKEDHIAVLFSILDGYYYEIRLKENAARTLALAMRKAVSELGRDDKNKAINFSGFREEQ